MRPGLLLVLATAVAGMVTTALPAVADPLTPPTTDTATATSVAATATSAAATSTSAAATSTSTTATATATTAISTASTASTTAPVLTPEIDAIAVPGDDLSVPLPGYTGGGTVSGENPARELEPGRFALPVVLRDESSLEAPRASVERALQAAEAAGAAARAASERLAAAEQQAAGESAALVEAHRLHAEAQTVLDRHRASLAGAAVAWYVKGTAPVDLASELLVPGSRTTRARVEVAADAAMEAVLDEVGGARVGADTSQQLVDGHLAQLPVAQATEAAARADVAATTAGSTAAQQELAARQAEFEAAASMTDPVVDGMGVSGGVTFPVAGSWEFRDSWGDPRSGGRRHRGSDVWAPQGTPLVSMEAGVARADADPLGGLTVWIEGESGATYYYAHLAGVHETVAEAGAVGRRVAAGEVVGFNGNTGNAIGGPPHLHIQIAPDGGDWANPYPVLAALSLAVTEARAAVLARGGIETPAG